jgi:pimeloyl-ACP methyl ester carboxylesterase
MKRIAYIIPGHGESHLRQKGYGKIAKLFEAQGITPVQVNIDWDAHKPAEFKQFVQQFLKQYKKPKGAEVYILGFSYGATTAFLSAAKTQPKAFIFCSLSPYFIEDQKNLKPAWMKWFRKNIVNSDYSFKELAPTITSKAYFIVGSEEHEVCHIRARSARRLIPNSSLTIAKGAKHNVGQKEYLATLEKIIKKL